MALAWLREKGVIIMNIPIPDEKKQRVAKWTYCITIVKADSDVSVSAEIDIVEKLHATYEEATEAAIKYSLENLI